MNDQDPGNLSGFITCLTREGPYLTTIVLKNAAFSLLILIIALGLALGGYRLARSRSPAQRWSGLLYILLLRSLPIAACILPALLVTSLITTTLTPSPLTIPAIMGQGKGLLRQATLVGMAGIFYSAYLTEALRVLHRKIVEIDGIDQPTLPRLCLTALPLIANHYLLIFCLNPILMAVMNPRHDIITLFKRMLATSQTTSLLVLLTTLLSIMLLIQLLFAALESYLKRKLTGPAATEN